MRIIGMMMVLLCGLVPAMAMAGSVKVDKMQVAITGMWNAYAPTTLQHKGKERMWYGGWLTQADQGEDMIYYSERSGTGSWSAPQLVFKKNNYSVNDPTVIAHPVHRDWLFMYYTALHKNHSNATDLVRKNLVGWATSTDGGKTWTDHDILIKQNNGFNSHGAWAPTAVLTPDNKEIWLYYHTNSPSNIMLRTRLDVNGWKQIGRTQQVRVSGSAQQNGRVNIDVARYGDNYYLATNELTLNDIGLYTSKDGLNFAPRLSARNGSQTRHVSWSNPILRGGANTMLTPHIVLSSPWLATVHFGFGTAGNACSVEWRSQGVADMLCSDSIHSWTLKLP